MAQIDNKFKVKKGLEVSGDAVLLNNVSVAGDLTITTQPNIDNSTKAASTAFVKNAVADLVAAAPGALDTLNELAEALGGDASFATTVTNKLATKAPLDAPALTGIPTAPTAPTENSTNQLATTAFVQANKTSPIFTGNPTAPTADVDTSTTQLATTSFVTNQAANAAPLMNGVAAIGTSKRYARQDHVHASDTSKANLSGANFTGPVSVTGNASLLGTALLQNTTDHMVIQSVAADKDIIFKTLGANEKVRIKSNGTLLIGDVTDNGTDKVIVDGNVKATLFKGGAELTGVATAPTAPATANDSQIATTAFVKAAVASNTVSPSFSGDVSFNGGVGSSNNITIPMVGGGNYITNLATVTGALKITLPVLYTGSMIKLKVSVQENGNDKEFDIVMSGFNGNSTWANVSAHVIGAAASKTPNVRFGNDGTNCCIWIGDIASTWSSPQVDISEVQIGYAGMASTWLSGWIVSFVTALDTVKIGPIFPFKTAGLASPALTGTPTAPTANTGTSTTQLATTAFVTTAVSTKADATSPVLTGTPTAPTAATGTNTTQIATTAFVNTAVSNVLGSAPAALDTLNELAAALGDDANFATTISTNLGTKAPLDSPALTGIPTAPTAAVDTDTTQLATTSYVVGQGYLKSVDASITYATKASPGLTGTPTSTTATKGTNTTQIATTAFVQQANKSVLAKNVAGGVGVALTSSEASNSVILFTGALTANIVVTFPTMTGIWSLVNKTTGAFTITVKMASGLGVSVSQNYAELVISDGVDMIVGHSDYSDIFLGGAPTATTAGNSDNSTRVATTAFVRSLLGSVNVDTVDGGSY